MTTKQLNNQSARIYAGLKSVIHDMEQAEVEQVRRSKSAERKATARASLHMFETMTGFDLDEWAFDTSDQDFDEWVENLPADRSQILAGLTDVILAAL